MRLFGRALRRADLPGTLTKGYNPHLKISIKRALKLGVVSLDEEATFYLDRELDPGIFKKRLNAKLPDGIAIKEARIQTI